MWDEYEMNEKGKSGLSERRLEMKVKRIEMMKMIEFAIQRRLGYNHTMIPTLRGSYLHHPSDNQIPALDLF